MKIVSFNVSGGFYVGNEDTEYLDRKAAERIDERLLQQIIDLMNAEDPDVVCFQEIITSPEVGYIDRIVAGTELKNRAEFELSPCNMVKDTNCGLAILSKHPLANVKKIFLPNPKLSKTTASGNTYYLYDKGMLLADVEMGEKSLRIFTHHNFPFGRFNSSADKHPEVFDFIRQTIEEEKPDFVTGDFNTLNYRELLNLDGYESSCHEGTAADGKQYDDIMVRVGMKYENKVIKSLSDHVMLVTEII